MIQLSMETKLKLELITQAQQHLVNNPQDPMHDITHHYRVVQIAKQLIAAEQLGDQVDSDLVEVICWWHDVKVPEIDYPADKRVVAVTAEYLSSLLPAELKEKGKDSIANHEFGSQPNFTEGKILQDADKLEILSEARVDLTVDNIKAGNLDKQKMLQTLTSIKTDWLPQMVERYHFEFSKKYHQDKLPSFLKYLEVAEQEITNLPA